MPRLARAALPRRRQRADGRREGRRPERRGRGRRCRCRVRAVAARRCLARGRRGRRRRAHLRRRERAADLLQRRRRTRALLVHPAGAAPARADHRRGLDRGRLTCAGAASARSLRGAGRRRARAARRRAPRAPAVGEGEPAHVRGAARLLPRARREGARMTVSLVGAGPGDPELITVRGLSRVRTCEVLVYDRLVAEEIVREAPIGALRISRDGLSQDDINALLVAHGKRGRRVVRLKGGDPVVFGRGGEEALALARAGVSFELVSGVSSIAAVPESVGIPVTHRGVSQMVTAFAANDVEQLDARALAQVPGTLVAFMGGAVVERLAERLIEHGKPASTPAAVVSCGTTEDEEVVVAPLGAIGAAAREAPTPALVVIGEVVAVREALGVLRRSAA